MRFMMMIKANHQSEAGQLPDEQALAAMAKYNQQLVDAGILLKAPDCRRARRAHA